MESIIEIPCLNKNKKNHFTTLFLEIQNKYSVNFVIEVISLQIFIDQSI